MKKINGVDNFSINSPTILTLGTFDGVHKGHQKILKKLKTEAKKDNLKSVVLTFFPHPRTVLNPDFPLKLINTIEERSNLFEKSGIDILSTHPFDKNFSELSPDEFVKNILVDKLNIKRSEIPAVTHVDYSARIQTVHKETNEKYFNLIQKFKEKTNCPVIVNTSFNVRGEPIVNTPIDSYNCFMGTELDKLVIGDCYLSKNNQDPSLKKDYKKEFELD